MNGIFKNVLLSSGFVLFGLSATAQCVMCKAQAEAQWEEDGSGINSGIIYIMVIPYIILFIVFHKHIFAFFKNWKKMR